MRTVKLIAVIALIFFFPSLSMGEVYRWVDEKGQVHFGSVPPKVQKPYKSGAIEKRDEPEPSNMVNKQKNPEVENTGATASTKEVQTNPESRADSNAGNKNGEAIDKNNKAVIEYKAKTEEEKRQLEEEERQRNKKFNALIKRLKSDLGVPKEQDPKAQSDQKTLQETETVKHEDEAKNNSSEQVKTVTKEGKTKKLELKTEQVKTEKAEKEEHEAKTEIESVEQAEVKDNEKCGFFKSFVENYEDRQKYECPSEHCDLILKKLEKYRNKVKQYCGEDNPG